MVSGSYELNINNLLDKTKTDRTGHLITPGIQLGMNHRQIDLSKLSFDNQFNGWYYDPGAASGESFSTYKKTNFNLNLGLTYQWIKNKRMQILAGYSIANITRPNQTFFGNDEIRRDIRHTVHLEGQFKVAKQWDVIPRVFMNFQGVYSELIFGAEAKYILKDERGSYMAGYLGAYLRNKDAVYLTFTFDYNNWKAGFSYDMNFSKLSPASNVRGGFEISLQYILKTFKPKKVQHRVCPDYI
jgi:type IX secretion system PorP/SprF family membrane protein